MVINVSGSWWYCEPSFFRRVYSILGNKPDINNKLLITPTLGIVPVGWTLYYELGAVSHLDQWNEWNEAQDSGSIVTILRNNDIKYIVVSYTSLDSYRRCAYEVYEKINKALNSIGAYIIYKSDGNPPPNSDADLDIYYAEPEYYGILEKPKWRKYIEIYEIPAKDITNFNRITG